jgi:hypothetical protein
MNQKTFNATTLTSEFNNFFLSGNGEIPLIERCESERLNRDYFTNCLLGIYFPDHEIRYT